MMALPKFFGMFLVSLYGNFRDFLSEGLLGLSKGWEERLGSYIGRF